METERREDRRKFLQRTATVAWGTPLLLTLSASQAGAQFPSCAPEGAPCGTWTGSACTGMTVICCGDCNPVALNVGAPCGCSTPP